MEEIKTATEIVDLATLKEKPVKWLDICTEEFEATFNKYVHKREWVSQRGGYEIYSLNGEGPDWIVDWDCISKDCTYTKDINEWRGGKKVYEEKKEYSLPYYPQSAKELYKRILEYLKKKGVEETAYDTIGGYGNYPLKPHTPNSSFSTFVIFQLLRSIEKEAGKEICYHWPKGFDHYGQYGASKDDVPYAHLKSLDGHLRCRIRVFPKDLSDLEWLQDWIEQSIHEFADEFSSWDRNVKRVWFEEGKTRPRAKKKNIEPSAEEKRKIAESALESILEETPDEVIDFLKKKKLFKEFKETYLENASKKSFTYLSYDADVMFGDADGTHHDYFGMTFEEFDYLKEWWEAYRKEYPGEEERNIYRVGYEEAGEGAYNIEAIDEILKDKTARVFEFDNGWSRVRVNPSIDTGAKFENQFENIDDEPDGDYGDGLPDFLLQYAAYWYTKGKTKNALLELPKCW